MSMQNKNIANALLRNVCYTTPSGNKNKHRIYQENTKSPTDPVYLDIDQLLVNRKQSTQWSKDAVFSWCSPQGQALAAQG